MVSIFERIRIYEYQDNNVVRYNKQIAYLKENS